MKCSLSLDCGTDCVDAYEGNTQLTLTATPSTDSIFTGWHDDCQGTDANTILTLNTDKTCTAQFQLLPPVLTLTVAGQGQISGPHLSCTPSGGECAAEYSLSETVTLTATDLGTWNFKEWQGDCVSTINPLPVLMNQSKHCSAIFEPGLWVGLVDFSATVLAKGTVLQWQTASEIDTVGFQLWQTQAKEGNCQSVNLLGQNCQRDPFHSLTHETPETSLMMRVDKPYRMGIAHHDESMMLHNYRCVMHTPYESSCG